MTVSIGKVHSAGGAAAYFAADNYYTAEQSEAASVWMGEGSRDLGLSGTVEASVFEKILDGKLPPGTRLRTRLADGAVESVVQALRVGQ